MRIRVVITILAVSAYIGCSEVQFQSAPTATCAAANDSFGANSCLESPDGTISLNYSVRVGEVDILFVDDNSGSMYTEQVEMANRFPGFLDSIRLLNYQIAITTTDISSSPNNPADQSNQNGLLQDGKFIAFPNGKSILSNPGESTSVHNANISHFQNTIKRPESLACDGSNFTNCPSSDERAIFAMNMAMDRSENQSFYRAGGHLAVVILSDEDERSNGGNFSGFAFEDYDKPSTFVTKTKQQLHPTKTVSVHSIIIRPGDTTCFNLQNSQPGVKGFYGNTYAALSNPSSELKALGNIVPGVLGSICSNNYTNELGSISNLIKDQTLGAIQLLCKPLDGSVAVDFDPAPNQQITFSVDQDNRVNLSPKAQPGMKVTLSYRCSKI